MSKHTPGPWEIRVHLSASENHKGFSICAPIHNGWALAEVRPGDQDGKMGHANARLIAAAPELLEALKALADEPVGEGYACHRGLMPMADCCRCGPVLRARAAIAKATGEQS